MPADDVELSGRVHHFGSLLRARAEARFPTFVALVRRGPATIVAGALVLVCLAGATWWVVRPAPHPPIESVLPLAPGAVPAGVGAGAVPSGAGTAGAATSPSGAVAGASGTPSAASAVAGLVVHVVGAVRTPGVVRLAPGARTLDAVAAAGGLLPEADLERINLASKLTDGQRIVVPRVGDPAAPAVVDAGVGAAGPSSVPSVEAPLNLNEATEAQLDQLPGVGPATAAAILAHRTTHGPFRTVDALGDVRGIGPAKLEQLRPLVTVS